MLTHVIVDNIGAPCSLLHIQMHIHIYFTNIQKPKTVEIQRTNESVMEEDFAPKVSKELYFFLIYTWTPIYPRRSRACERVAKRQFLCPAPVASSIRTYISSSLSISIYVQRCEKTSDVKNKTFKVKFTKLLN